MRLTVVVLVACSACGRLSFDPQAGAIALVQEATGTVVGGVTLTVALPTPTIAGDVIVMMASTDTMIDKIATVTGGGSTDWSEIATVAGLGMNCAGCIRGAMWSGTVSSSGGTSVLIDVTPIADDFAVSVTEWSGVAAVESVQSLGPLKTKAIATPTSMPEHVDDLVIAMVGWDGSTLSAGPNGGFTALAPATVPGASALAAAWSITGAPASAGWVLATAPQCWSAIIATFSR